jgi:hypothetical protein
MARIASQSKGGYYKTPVEEMNLILKRIRFVGSHDNNLVNLIDPCAGEGEALAMLAKHLRSQGAETDARGCELEKGRAEIAGTVLDQVIQDGYERLRTEPKFSVLWLNPVYDDAFDERMETTFLRDLTGWKNVMEKGGLFMFCVPQLVLEETAGLLASRFQNIQVYRFTDENYPVFKQIVLFGNYNKEHDAKKRRQTAKWLRELAYVEPEIIPTLDVEDGVMFTIRPSAEPVAYFRAGIDNIEELTKDLSLSSVFTEMEKVLNPTSLRSTELKNPLLPLKATHYGTAIAAGAVGGNMATHIITGITKLKVQKKEEKDGDGKVTSEVYTKHYQALVRVFSPQGVFDLE